MSLRESDKDTIAAIATAAGEGGIGIVRFSGPASIGIADKIFKARAGRVAEQEGFTARLGSVVADGRVVDEGLCLVMRAPKSYTTEDMVELQVHGGMAILQEVLRLALREGARLAGPGEFTKRAYLNGRIDLLQAEAVLDLIQAKSEKTRKWASAQLDGSLSRRAAAIKKDLIEALASLEASIDFPEDETGAGELGPVSERVARALASVEGLLAGAETAILVKRGITLSLWGRPNTGKSSLFNALARENRVIVAATPGTTRDVVEEEILVGGIPVRVRDTAGVRDSADPVEREGVERSRKAAMGAGLVLFVVDASQYLTPDDQKLYEEIQDKPHVVVLNKSDLKPLVDPEDIASHWPRVAAVSRASSVKPDGVKALEGEILRLVTGGQTDLADEAPVNSARQKEALEKVRESLRAAAAACREKRSPELVAVDIRESLDHLGVLVGDIANDEMLDVLFGQFCIGK